MGVLESGLRDGSTNFQSWEKNAQRAPLISSWNPSVSHHGMDELLLCMMTMIAFLQIVLLRSSEKRLA